MQSFQQQELFCLECGAANAPGALTCAACQHALSLPEAAVPPSVPQPVAPRVRREATAGLSARPGTRALLHARYRLLKEIGQGGFGAVYRARDRQQRNRLVAIKQIDLSGLRPQEVIEVTDSFNREVTLLSQLKHPGLPLLYENFTEGNCWYLVMEYIHGRTLEDLLKRSRRGYFSLSKAASIIQKLADVLWYLHRQTPPIIFRDVKPANCMVTRRGRVYLIDFGIARRFSPGKQRDTGPLGSPGYAAPEQYGKAQTDARTDIYGLGATLQTLLTGCDPLDLSAGEAPRNPKPLPADLQELLTATMEADPGKRPQEMLTFEERLQKLLYWRHNWRDFCQGLLFGGIFLLWGVLSTFLLFLGHSGQALPGYMYSVSLQCLLLTFSSLFPLGAFATAIWQIAHIIRGHRPWFAFGVLLLLFCTLVLTLLIAIGFIRFG